MTRSRRAGHLVAEAVREVAVLGTVFVSIDAGNDGRLTTGLLLFTVVVGSVVFSLGVWLEVRR